MKRYLYLFLVIPAMCLSKGVYGQQQGEKEDVYRSPIRKIFNIFSINLATGYGLTRYSHNLSDYYLIQTTDQSYILFNNGEAVPDPTDGTINWINNPSIEEDIDLRTLFTVPFQRLEDPVDNPLLIGANIYQGDSLDLRLVGIGHNIPVNLSIHADIWKFRIGGGIQWEKQWIRPFKPTVLKNEIRDVRPNFGSNNFFRYYGMAGYQFYDWWDLTFTAELQIGKIKGANNFNPALITRGLVTNVGVMIEDNWSEYFRVTLKPGIDIKNYTIALPDGSALRHNYHAFYLQVGVSYTFPEIPRSPIKNDHIQLKHIITNPKNGKRMEVRGQPFWKKQNPKIGENNRKVLRRKGKNKKKFNPF